MNGNDLLVIAAAALIFLPLEQLFPLHKDHRWAWPRVGVDLLHVFLSGMLIRAGALATTLALSYAALALIPVGARDAVRAQPDWLEYVELLVLADLGFYVAHRIVHQVPLLWRFHAIHHSSEQLDWLATFRVHPVDQIFNSAIIALPAIVIGFSPGPLLAYALVYRWHAIYLHSNIGIGTGPLGKLVTSPHFHHWHHADEREAYDRNFGGQLILWDWLFGTIHQPPRLPLGYGVSDRVPTGYAGQLLEPFGLSGSAPVTAGAGQQGESL